MRNKIPTVSLGMPVYNEETWLSQALDALLAQTFGDFELIVSDNASTDQTWPILQSYAAKDSRIVLHRQSANIGPIENFKFVLSEAHGDCFLWASGHDLWSVNLLETLVQEMQADPELVLCVPQAVLIDEENKPIMGFDEVFNTRPAESAASRVLLMQQTMKRCNAIYGLHRRSVLVRALPWPKVVGGDSILLIRIAALGHIVTNRAAHWYRRRIRQEAHQDRIQH